MIRIIIRITWLLVGLAVAQKNYPGDIRPGVYELDVPPLYDENLLDTTIPIRPRDGTDYLLPDDTKPIHYNLWIKTAIDENNFDYRGKVEITIEVVKGTNSIVLHAKNLDITSINLVESNGHTPVEIENWIFVDEYDFLVVNLNENLVPDEIYYLHIEWDAVLRLETQYNGFYRSKYTDANNDEM